MSIEWLIKNACENLKVFLMSVRAQEKNDWQKFLQIVYNELWIVSFEKTKKLSSVNMVNNISHINSSIIQSKKENIRILYCVIHGRCMHTTENCNKFKMYISEFKNKIDKKNLIKNNNKNKISRIKKSTIKAKKSITNNNNIIFTTQANIMANKRTKESLFRINGFSEKGKIECLIDTGAQCSILNVKQIPQTTQIIALKSDIKLLSASGDNLKIIGMVKKFRINYIIFPPGEDNIVDSRS
jgi:hypothetical protein